MRSISLILILAAIPAHAQSWSPEVFRDSVVVTASALPEEVDSTPASVSVVTREQIERRNALDLEEVLRELPGMFLARAGSAGRQTSLFTRGVNSAQTLVLWNGIEINNPYFSGYDWGQFSTAGVEKIEVVRGPFSSLYGADAVGGVINVVTGANEPGVSADLQVGEHELLNGRIETTGVWSELRADVAVESREDEGFHPNDDFSQTALLGSLSWEMNERISVGFSGRFNDYELGIPFDQGEPSLQRRQEGSELQLAIPLTLELGETTWDVSLSRTEHEIDFADPLASFGPIETMTDSEINRASLSVRFPTPIGTVIAGGELEDATVDDESLFGTNLDQAERRSRSIFVEDRFSAEVGNGELELSAGVRYDDFEEFGSETSPRLSAGWSVGTVRARVAWGEAFRAPSIGDLFYPFFGNPDLGAERSQSWEAGVDWSGAKGSISATWFDNGIEDLIVFDPSTNRAENIGAATTRGLELGGRIRFGVVRLEGSWTILDTEDESTGLDLLRRPEQSGSLSVFFQHDRFSTLLSAIHSGARADFEPVFPFSRVENDGYTVVDLDLRYEAGPTLVPYLRIENLLDEEYQEVLGFPAPPRRAIIGLRYIR